MAMTPNGFIAKTDDDTSWISAEEWNSYSSITRNAGNLIVGHRTYDILTKQPEFSELKDVKLVVVSTKEIKLLADNHLVAGSPKEALKSFENAKEVIVAGGGNLNASFLAEDLVDEIYLDIEPIIFGNGIPLFQEKDFENRLIFLGMKNITQNEVQLHYQVLK